MTFYAGELVSCGYAIGTVITGRVIELKRRSDGAPFLMVDITSGPKQGERDWPSSWQLGVGSHQATCERCRRAFRYQEGEVSHSCQRCWNGDQVRARGANPERPSSSWEREQRRRSGEKELVTT